MIWSTALFYYDFRNHLVEDLMIATDIYRELMVDYPFLPELKKNLSKPNKNQANHCNSRILAFHTTLKPTLGCQ